MCIKLEVKCFQFKYLLLFQITFVSATFLHLFERKTGDTRPGSASNCPADPFNFGYFASMATTEAAIRDLSSQIRYENGTVSIAHSVASDAGATMQNLHDSLFLMFMFQNNKNLSCSIMFQS